MSQVLEIDGGRLVHLSFDGAVWRFEFKNKLAVESLGGWRLFEAASAPGNRTILGSRDLESSENPLDELSQEIPEFELKVLYFNQMKETLELSMMPDGLERSVSIQLHNTSGRLENWRMQGEDFDDSDKLKIIQNLDIWT